MTFADVFGTDSTEAVDRKIDAQRAIEKLGHIDRAILYLWVVGYTQAEIAHMFGYSRRHVNTLLNNISKRGT